MRYIGVGLELNIKCLCECFRRTNYTFCTINYVINYKMGNDLANVV